jgi:hypothetical protein
VRSVEGDVHMMSVIVQRGLGGPRRRPRARPHPSFCPRFIILAAVVAILLGTCATSASAEEASITAGLGISIRRVIKVKFASPFDPNGRPRVDGEGTTAVEAVPAVEVAEISVATNVADWGVLVRFALPDGGRPKYRDATALCRLVREDGKVISERLVEDGEVFLEGNGRCGDHTLFLEVDGFLKAFGVETLTEPMVDLEGWSAGESR